MSLFMAVARRKFIDAVHQLSAAAVAAAEDYLLNNLQPVTECERSVNDFFKPLGFVIYVHMHK